MTNENPKMSLREAEEFRAKLIARVKARSEAKAGAKAIPDKPSQDGEPGLPLNLRVAPKPTVIVPPAPAIEVPEVPQIIVPPSGDDPRRASSVGRKKFDFISTYADWADQYEVPRAVHEAFAIQLIASLLNRSNVLIDCGGYQLTFDLWIAILAGSGAGKNTASNAGSPVIDALAQPTHNSAPIINLIENRDWGSKEAFYQQLSGRAPGGLVSTTQSKFYMWEEMSTQLGKLDSNGFDGVKGWLTNLYDNVKKPPEIGYSDTGKQSNTPSIVFDHAPRTNILALTAESWFFRNLRTNDSMGGFVPRWTIIDAPGERFIHRTTKPNPAMVPEFTAALQDIAALTGQVVMFKGFWDDGGPHEKWYNDTGRRFVKTDASLGRIFFNRHRVHVLKLAAIFEASMSRSLQVSPEAWDRAVKKAAELEATLVRLLQTGMTDNGYILGRMEDAVLKCGPSGMPLNEFTKMFKNEPFRKQQLQTLLDSEILFVVRPAKPGPGRPPVFLVHSKFHGQSAEAPAAT
jgi:hypothetical protein